MGWRTKKQEVPANVVIKEPELDKSQYRQSMATKDNLSPIIPRVREVKQETEEIQVIERIQVVKELPMERKEFEDGTISFRPNRQMKEKNGDIIHFMTVEEALTEIMNNLE